MYCTLGHMLWHTVRHTYARNKELFIATLVTNYMHTACDTECASAQ